MSSSTPAGDNGAVPTGSGSGTKMGNLAHGIANAAGYLPQAVSAAERAAVVGNKVMGHFASSSSGFATSTTPAANANAQETAQGAAVAATATATGAAVRRGQATQPRGPRGYMG